MTTNIKATNNSIHFPCIVLGVHGVLKPHIALSYASCYMSFSTLPLVLYFPYSIHTSPLTTIYIY